MKNILITGVAKGIENSIAVQKNRKNDICDMQAWYYQVENNTLAYAVLKGVHGERTDIPQLRKYYICDGEAVFIIDGEKHQVTCGSIVEIPAHSTYDFYSVGDEAVRFFVDIGYKIDFDTIPSK
ncbi:MAG: cupin domain-containing protein [bacterium]|nr:cupin domain-containing protein [bacterium]